MLCKNCGKRIKPTDNTCPWCGEAQSRIEGGNGFWDIVDRKNEDTISRDTHDEQSEIFHNLKRPSQGLILNICALSLSAVAIILCIGSMLWTSTLNGRIRQSEEILDTRSQEAAQLRDEVSRLRETVDLMQAEPMPDKENRTENKDGTEAADSGISITKQPTRETVSLGNSKGVFKIIAEGDEISFTWEKLDQYTGEWNSISTDSGLYNVSCSRTGPEESCVLTVNNADMSVLGTYRCRLSNKSGAAVYSGEVTLTLYTESEQESTLSVPNQSAAAAPVPATPVPTVPPTPAPTEAQPTAAPTPPVINSPTQTPLV